MMDALTGDFSGYSTVQSAKKRWEKHKEKREKSLASFRAAHRRASCENEKVPTTGKVPLEILTRDWLNKQQVDTGQRVYLVENLLPSLVVGLEKLLTEVSKRGLVEDKEENPEFNPINYLAQHLMRNNPKYSNFAEAHPYCRTMCEVSEELKKMAYSVENTQLSQIKSDIRKRREEREKAESALALEAERRKELLKGACSKWVLSDKDNLVTAEIQLALLSWLDLMSTHSLASTLTDLFAQLFPPDADYLISETSLVSRLKEAGEELPGSVIDSLAEHLEVCGLERRRRKQKEQRRALFGELFKSCDPDMTGFVDRLRVLHLFNCFYDSASSDNQDKFHNPRKWPIVEVAEAEELEEDEERKSSAMMTSSLTEEDYQEFLAGTIDREETPSHQPPTHSPQEPQDKPMTSTDQTDGANTDQPTEGPVKSVSEESRPPLPKEEGSSQQPSKTSAESQQPLETPTESQQPSETPAESQQPSEIPTESQQPPETPAESQQPPGTPAESQKPSEIPAESQKPSETPTESQQPPETPAESQQQPEAPTESRQQPEAPTESQQPPEAPTESQQQPEAPAESQQPEASTESQQQPEAPTESQQPPEAPTEFQQQPEAPTESQQPPEAPTESQQPSETPIESQQPPETPAELLDTRPESEIAELRTKGDESRPESHQNESLPDGREPTPLRSCANSVIERRLATADRYGRSAPISVMRKLSGMGSRPVSPSGPGSSWDHLVLNCSQFVQLVELFIASPNPSDSIVNSFSSFIRDNYTETAEERAERLELAQQQKLILIKRFQINSLFEVWDSDRSGYLELDELQLVLGRWKGFNSEQAREHAKEILLSLGAQQARLSRANFHAYIEELTEGMKLAEFEEFSEYLMTSVKLSFEEVRRGEKRKALMDRISQAGRASGLQFTKGMTAAVEAIHEDNAEFGKGKSCSVAMALLEPVSPSSPDTLCLSYKAASEDVAAKVVGRKLLRSFKQGVSHKAVDLGRPVCVQDIRGHGGVYFFIPEHQEEYNGSLVVSPIITPRETVVGTFSVDSLREQSEEGLDTAFLTHEINFYQGVGVCLGEVFHWIEARQKLITVSQSALSWVHRRCPQVTQSVVYIVEPCPDPPSKCPYALRCMLTMSGPNDQSHTNKLLTREDNIFRDYLFQCVEDSEPIMANAYGQHHLAYPIRDWTGCAVAVLDLYMPPTQNLRPSQLKEVTKVLKLLTLAFSQLTRVPERVTDANGLGKALLTQESTKHLDQDVSVLFDQLMLSDLKMSVSKLDNRVFAEMRSYIDPPAAVMGIVRALLYILYPDKDFETWAKCKQYVTVSLLSDLQDFDPLCCEETPHKRLDLIKEILRDVQTGSVQEQASHPAKYIYGWVNVCISLLDHAANKPSLALTGNNRSRPSSGTSIASSQPE